jgi:hypothetical protein
MGWVWEDYKKNPIAMFHRTWRTWDDAHAILIPGITARLSLDHAIQYAESIPKTYAGFLAACLLPRLVERHGPDASRFYLRIKGDGISMMPVTSLDIAEHMIRDRTSMAHISNPDIARGCRSAIDEIAQVESQRSDTYDQRINDVIWSGVGHDPESYPWICELLTNAYLKKGASARRGTLHGASAWICREGNLRLVPMRTKMELHFGSCGRWMRHRSTQGLPWDEENRRLATQPLRGLRGFIMSSVMGFRHMKVPQVQGSMPVHATQQRSSSQCPAITDATLGNAERMIPYAKLLLQWKRAADEYGLAVNMDPLLNEFLCHMMGDTDRLIDIASSTNPWDHQAEGP